MISYENIVLKSTSLGNESLIPDIAGESSLPFFHSGENFKPEMLPRLGEGLLASKLPYTMQDGYDRCFKDREYKAIVLENEYLKAVFLPQFGARLWSLYDKKKKADIIYKNDVLVFANLGLRNAWFAGGVEWNAAVRGHGYFTCDDIFCEFEKAKDGRDILKVFQYVATRGIVYVMRFALDEDKLCVNITVHNTNDKPSYMYWWSNIAVEQKKSSRVLVPTNKSFVTSYRDGGFVISHLDVPYIDGVDVSYPAAAETSKDYFYDIPKENNKWQYSVDDSNLGLLHYSTKELIGRKLFVWGQNQGGDHWNKWLTESRDYLEVQAGLLETQFQHFIMEANDKISWTEVYTAYELKNNSYDGDYDSIKDEVDGYVGKQNISFDFFNEPQSALLVHMGDGKAALHEKFTGKKLTDLCDFPEESIGEKEKYYGDLADGMVKGEDYKISYCGDRQVAELILAKEERTGLDNYLLGINFYINGDYENTVKYLTLALDGKQKALAAISLALYYGNHTEDGEKAYGYAKLATETEPCNKGILITYASLAIRYKKFDDCMEKILANPENVKTGRLNMYLSSCYIARGELEKAREILVPGLVVPDIREGEYSLGDTYIELYRQIIKRDENRTDEITNEEVLEKYPLAYELDFRMH